MMRNTLLAVLAFLLLSACTQKDRGYTISVELEDAGGKWVRVYQRIDRQYVLMDSVYVGTASPAYMSGRAARVTSMYLSVEGEARRTRFLLENAEYWVRGSVQDPVITSQGKAQTDLLAYEALIDPYEKTLDTTIEAYYAAREMEDSRTADSLYGVIDELYEQESRAAFAYIREHPASYGSVIALRENFFYLDTDELERVLNSLDPEVQQLEEYSYMHGKMEKQKAVAPGNPYKDFGLYTPDGEFLKVSDVQRGQVLLIDFWASWCSPCRRANPGLVRMYDELHDRGFEILQVSLDDERDSWLYAIESDGLGAWKQISDLKGWESAGAELYGVPAIPHSVLVDREGIIRATKLEGEELREAIEALL
jgi:thiol-disulfide isomerase/thioredoxin